MRPRCGPDALLRLGNGRDEAVRSAPTAKLPLIHRAVPAARVLFRLQRNQSRDHVVTCVLSFSPSLTAVSQRSSAIHSNAFV